MAKCNQVHRGLAYGDGFMSGAGACGKVVKLVGNDTFALNSGESAPTTQSFGVLAKDCADGGRPTVFTQKGIYETDVFSGENLQAGDGLYCDSNAKLAGGYDDSMQAIKASKTIGATGKQITLQCKFGGALGNTVTITLVKSGNSTALAVTVDGTDISVALATDSDGDITSTCKDVVDAINEDDEASVIVRAATSNDEAVIAAGVTKTNLAGGANAALRIGRVISVVDGLLKFALEV